MIELSMCWGGKLITERSSNEGTNDGWNKSFRVTLKNSPEFRRGAIPYEYIASNMAYTIYKAWDDKERRKYGEIKCTLIDDSDAQTSSTEFDYKTDELESALRNEKFFHYCESKLRNDQFTELASRMDTSFSQQEIPQQLQVLDATLKKLESESGNISGEVLVAFKFDKSSGLIRYSGYLKGDRPNTLLKVEVLPKKELTDIFFTNCPLPGNRLCIRTSPPCTGTV